jgi:hypothetical protein
MEKKILILSSKIFPNHRFIFFWTRIFTILIYNRVEIEMI